MDNYNNRVNWALDQSLIKAASLSHEYVTLEHLLYVLMEEKDVLELLAKMDCSCSNIIRDLEENLAQREDITVEKLDGMGNPDKLWHLIVFSIVQ